jgi:hypothetical protein
MFIEYTFANFMRERVICLGLLVMFNFCGYAQTVFENGYFISENDERIDCLIENIDWKNNPTAFKYMIAGSAESKKAEIQNVKEFGLTNISRYIRATVNIDRSEPVLVTNTYDKNPVFREEQLFLKVLIEGKASLFLYEDGNLTRFFYRTDGEIKQLVYKEYLTEEKNIMKNNLFRQQLYNDLRSDAVAARDLERLSYSQRHLERVFVAYNMSVNSTYIDFDTPKKRDRFNLNFRPGVNSSSLSINSSSSSAEASIENSLGFRLGLEAEFILPFNNSKWAIIVEPTYQSFKESTTTNASNVAGGTRTTTVDYTSLELPVGFRHYFFLSDESKIFVNAGVVLDFSLDSHIVFSRSDGSELSSLDVKSRPNFAFGTGYKYKRYSFEVRYFTNRNVLSDYLHWQSEYKTFSATVGYSF